MSTQNARTVRELIDALPASGLRLVAGPPDAIVESLLLAEATSEVELAPAAGLVVLTEQASAALGAYRLDVLVRRAAERRLAGVILLGPASASATAAAIADRGGVALLEAPPATSAPELALALLRCLRGDAELVLSRLELLARRLDAADGDEPERLLAAAGAAFGSPFSYSPQASAGAAVSVHGRPAGGVAGTDPSPGGALAARLVASALSAALARREREERVAIRSSGALLAELLLAPAGRSAPLLERARELGMPVDGFSTVLRIEGLAGLDLDPIAAWERAEDLTSVALAAAATRCSGWYAASIDDALLLVRMARTLEPSAGAAAVEAAAAAVRRLAARAPGCDPRCGVGSPHEGASGLRASAAEARAALTAAPTGRAQRVTAFDGLGLRRMLVDWLDSETARGSVQEALAPLDRLGPQKSEAMVRTLHAYLDERGSLVRAASRLHLHRNAVHQRMRKIDALLGVDLDDPDERFALQLACRARMLSLGAG